MKVILLFALCATAAFAVDTEIDFSEESSSVEQLYIIEDVDTIEMERSYNGKPCCPLPRGERMRRNNNDPTKYWTCNRRNQAELNACPTSNLFFENLSKCIHTNYWYWTPPKHTSSTCGGGSGGGGGGGGSGGLPKCTPRCVWPTKNDLWQVSGGDFFWQCTPSGVQKMPCAPGTKFSQYHQVCVHARDWKPSCK